jgi:hypothetical protein
MLGLLRERQPRHLVERAEVLQWFWDGCADLPKTATRTPMRPTAFIECRMKSLPRSEASAARTPRQTRTINISPIG